MYILIIDDDPQNCELFYKAVREVGSDFQCARAADGKEGLSLLQNDPIKLRDFIFLDINMPAMNGKECLMQIKQHDKLRSIPVIMYSTTSNANEIGSYRKLGAHDFLIKPHNFNRLVEALRSIILANGKSKDQD